MKILLLNYIFYLVSKKKMETYIRNQNFEFIRIDWLTDQ